MKKLLLILNIPLFLFCQNIIVVGNSNNHDLDYISSSLNINDMNHRTWDSYSNQVLVDSIIQLNNSIVLFQIESYLDSIIVGTLENKVNDNNIFLVFSNTIENDERINDFFGFIKLRNSLSESIIDLEDARVWNFNDNEMISELSWIGTSEPISVFSETNAFSMIHKKYPMGLVSLAGFNLDSIQDLPNYLQDLISSVSSIYNHIIIEDVIGYPGDTIYIPINTNFIDDIIGLSFSVQSDPEYLDFISVENEESNDNFEWEISQLPFGIVEINGATNSGVLENGFNNIGFLKAVLYPSSSNKISLRGLENIITYDSGESVQGLFINGEIEVLYNNPIIHLKAPNLIEPDSLGIMEIHLNTDHNISAIQLCINYDSSILDIENIIPTLNLPESWFFTYINNSLNNYVEMFSFGFDPIGGMSGKIFDVHFQSLNDYEQQTAVYFCDILLAGMDNENIIPLSIPTNISINFPDINIIPKKIVHNQNLDILYYTNNFQNITGFQFDVSFQNNIDIIETFNGNITKNYLGNWITLSDSSARFVYFDNNQPVEFNAMGYLLNTSFVINENTEENEFYFEIENIIVTDQHYEPLKVKFNDFTLENNPTTISDINGDNFIDIIDVLIITDYITENLQLGYAQLKVSDVNNDNNINIEDILLIVSDIL